jgi:hypothetical protein
MDLLAKFVQVAAVFTPEDWAAVLRAIADGDRATVMKMLELTPAEAEIAFEGIDSLQVKH